MTDKSKNERRPARRPGGDAARTSKGATKFAGPGKFSGRSFAGGGDSADKGSGGKALGSKGLGSKNFGGKGGGRRFGDESPEGGKSYAGKSFSGKSFSGKPYADKPYAGKSYGGKSSSGGKSAGDRPSYGKPRPGRFADERATSTGARFGGPRPGPRPDRAERPARQETRQEISHETRRDEAAVEAVRPDAPERIAKAMSRAGVASRRDAELMIGEGRVAVNGTVIDTPVTLVTSKDRVEIDGAPMPSRDRTRLWLYHKPRGLVTTARDPEGRPTVFEALPEELPRVVAVGRLDINTEGLLLLTNDGGLSRVLAHPETGWLRRYRVRAYGDIDQAQLDALSKGITIDEMHYGPVEAAIQRRQGDNVWLTLGLREGKNREVKRILEHLGLQVNRLIRVSFGPFQLGDLPEGEVDEVRTRILKDQLGEKLAAEAGADFDSGSFEPSVQQAPKADRPAAVAREGRYRSKEDFLARAPRAQHTASAPYKRGAFEERSRARAVWRDDDTEGGRAKGTRIPRRGADPHAARELSAERVHERAGAITDPDGRKVKVERIVAPERPVERKYRDRPDAPRPSRGERGDRFEQRGERPARRFDDRSDRPARPEGRERFGDRPNRFSDRGDGASQPRGDRPARRFDERSDRPARPEGRERFGDRPNRFSDRGDGASQPRGNRPARRFDERSDRPARPEGRERFGDRPNRFADRGDGASQPRGDRPARRFDERSDRPARPEGRERFGDRPNRFADRGDGASQPRGDRPARRFDERSDRPARPEGRERFGDRPNRFADRGDGASQPRGDRPARRFDERSDRPALPEGRERFGDRPNRFGEGAGGRKPAGDRSFDKRGFGKPSGDRPAGKRFDGGRPSADRPSGNRPAGGRPSGSGRPSGGGRPGGKPFGDRPSGGPRPGGSGGRPSRPPRKF